MELSKVEVALGLQLLALSMAIDINGVVIDLVNESVVLILLELCIDAVDLEEALPEPVRRQFELLVVADLRRLSFTYGTVL